MPNYGPFWSELTRGRSSASSSFPPKISWLDWRISWLERSWLLYFTLLVEFSLDPLTLRDVVGSSFLDGLISWKERGCLFSSDQLTRGRSSTLLSWLSPSLISWLEGGRLFFFLGRVLLGSFLNDLQLKIAEFWWEKIFFCVYSEGRKRKREC